MVVAWDQSFQVSGVRGCYVFDVSHHDFKG